YYTHQQDFETFRIAKAHVLKQLGNQSLYKMDEDDRKIFANAVREYVIDSTAIPVSLSAKLSKFEEVDNRYPNLTRVFEGNGYGVWERTSAAHIE
ncbi:MAG: hypothetical protein QMC70_07250, partial [Bacteroidia bacterium]